MPYTSNLTVSDLTLEAIAEWLRGEWDSASCNTHLFDATITPDPETVEGDLTEASYPGYAELPMNDKWQAVARDEPGAWTFRSEWIVFEWDQDLAGDTTGPVDIYGGYLMLGEDIQLVGVFEGGPLELDDGIPLRVRWEVTIYDGQVFAALVSA